MTITVPDDMAKALLAELEGQRSRTQEALKTKLQAGLKRERQLTADELALVLFVLDAGNPTALAVGMGADRMAETVARFRSAQAKIRTLHSAQVERETREGRR